MSEPITLFAQVLLPLPLPKAFTYRVPQEWNDLVQIGQRVAVQFGGRRVYAGILVDFTDEPPKNYTASYLLEILDDEPVVSPSQLKFWNWIASYYMCHTGEVMAAALPAGFRLQSESLLTLSSEYDPEIALELDEKEEIILSLLLKKNTIKVDEAAEAIGLKSPMKYIKSLHDRGMVMLQEEMRENYRPKTEVYVRLAALWNNEAEATEMLNALEKKAPKQANVILSLLGMGGKDMSRKELKAKYDIETSHIRALEKKQLVHTELRQESRFVDRNPTAKEFILSEEQAIAAAEIEVAFSQGKNALLHGVTGSGKTFVYQHFAKKTMEQGKQVLYLVPEVGLTEHLVRRLSQYFGSGFGVWHHYYSANERTELYAKIASGEIQFLLGTRSAVFAPFQKLGLIIVDEEHETSYKQFEKRPHYHGRDAAMYLAASTKSNVLLGSATPSYELKNAAESGKLAWIRLQKRYEMLPAPQIELIHTGEAKKQNRMKSVFSSYMLEGIQSALDNRGQIIVYQNRKGYVPYISCDFCGTAAHCVNCDIALTYYKSLNKQKCSYCGYTQDPVSSCSVCGSTSLSMKGFGTERLAEELSIFFPEARISRFDQESIRNRKDFQSILGGFERGEIDILVGTQLLSKGLDFKNVHVVAIPDADMLLNIPDFRSHERAFQQMHQVAGRAGRGSKSGRVMVQTHQPSHPVLTSLVEGDYNGLADQELEMRRALDYPPFTRLIRVLIRHKDALVAKEAATVFVDGIVPNLKERVLGPQAPVVSKIRNYYLQHVLIKLNPEKDNILKVKNYLSAVSVSLTQMKHFRSVRVDFDVDPN